MNESIGRLDGWKEIAEFLGGIVATAVEYEKKYSLPVRRLPSSKVFAFKHEIIEWQLSTSKKNR